MKLNWLKMITGGLVALAITACAPGQPSTPAVLLETQPATSQASPTETGEVSATQALEPTRTFEVAMTLEPDPGDQEQTVNQPIPTPEDPYLMKLVQQGLDDLTQRLGIPAEQIELVAFEAVTWSDGSLGCPQPGMAYTQALVDGLLMRFQAQGQVYEYHSGGRRAPFLCENPPKLK